MTDSPPNGPTPWSFLVIFLVPVAIFTGYLAGGNWNFLTPVVVFGLVPLVDLALGRDTKNLTEEQEQALKDDLRFRAVTFICAPIQVGMVFWGGHVISSGQLPFWPALGLTLSIGVSSGVIGINVSHELLHRVNSRFEQFLSRAMLCTVFYLHWSIEHLVGHHRNVATPGDPATARLGESFYRFLPRTVSGGFTSAWALEAERLARKGKNPKGPGNRLFWYMAAQAGLVVLFAWWFGFFGLLFLLVQAAVAVGLLEIVNYVEHYGLLRKKQEDGSFAPVKPVHSWNSSNALTNRFLFNLQRHSDHHFRPNRRYQVLRHFDESPQLPTGYSGMLLLAAVPPLWRTVMDHRVPPGA
ncbi:MAG: alkane 1-monooxygenase [Proteobacteria bacterium]|nr:alkane 1-monooxygenase [Pseudomonadota bacterium]